jgi:tetratricopeptide (TPR) repeat protein
MPKTRILIAFVLGLGLLTGCSKEAKKARLLKRAEADYAQGEYDKAKIEYLNLLRLDQSNPAPYENIGRIWLEEGAPLRAAPYLLKAQELQPNNAANRLRLAQLFLGMGRWDDARQEALAVLKLNPGSAEALRFLADASRTPEQIAQANEELQKFPNRDDASFQLALAAVAIRKKDQKSAREALEKALALDPHSYLAHSFMAMYWLSAREPAKARQEFKTAAELAPLRSVERLQYAQVIAQSGAVDEAIASLQAIAKAAPDYLPAWNAIAQLTFAQKKYDEALKFVENALNRDAENVDANLLRAKILLAKGQKDQAIEAFKRLEEKYPKFALVDYQLARCYLEKQDVGQAAAYLNKAVAANPDFIEAILLLGQLDLKRGNAQLTADSMRNLLKKRPQLWPARLLLADAYRSLGRLDEAADIFREQIKSSPKNAGAYLGLGLILLQQKKGAEGRQALETAAELAPNNLVAAVQLIDSYMAARDFEKALKFAQQQVSRTPKSALAHFMVAEVYAGQAKWDLAEANLSKALSLDPNFAPAYKLLSSAYLATNRPADAARELEALVSKKPNDVAAMLTLAMLNEKLQNFSRARELYEKVLSVSPKAAVALNNLAYLYAAHFDQLDQAYQLAQKAHGLQPDDASIDDTLGWILYQKKQYEQALVLLQESAGKSPNEPEISYHLGMAQYMMGHKEAARTALEKTLQMAPGSPHAADIKRRLLFLSDSSSAVQPSLEDLKKAVEEQPGDIIALDRLGTAYEKQNQFKQAADAYEKALDRNPDLLSVLTKLARIYAGPLKDNDQALEMAKRARDLAPNDYGISALLGRIAYQARNFTWAYSLLEESSLHLADQPQVHYQFSWAAFSLGKLDEARAALERVVQLAPGSALAADAKRFVDMIAVCQHPEKAPSQAAEIAGVLHHDPSYLPAQLAQAAVEKAGGNLKGAAEIYEKVLAQLPDCAVAEKDLAGVYLAEGSGDDAKTYELAMKARKALPDDPEVANMLAEISFRRKEYSRALELLQESARKHALDAKHLYYLGISSFQTKHSSDARQALDQALANGLQDPFASDARRVLAGLQQD